MDFFSLAESTTPQALRRYLGGAEDDDFSHLDTTHTSNHQDFGHASDSILDITSSLGDGSNGDLENAPMLSPAAEAELFMLATNFLLYVAMVLIIVMVCKTYFPEALERKEPQMSSGPGTRSINYRQVVSTEKESNNSSSEVELAGSQDSIFYDDDDLAYNSTFDEDESLIAEQQALFDGDLAPTGSTKKLVGRNEHKKENSRMSSFADSFAFEQEQTSRGVVIRRLLTCIIMLNVTFVIWGVLQERMLTRRYPRYTGEFFTYSYALVFTNRFWTLIMSGLLMIYFKPKRSCSTVIYEYSFPSISNMLSSWCQYESLRYVSFPAVTLFKSFKLAPVMAMGKFLGNKQYPSYDYYVALCIGIGITMFMSSTDNLGFGYNIYDQKASATWTGIMLLGFFLFFDSFTSQWQSRMFQRHRDLSMIELMFATSAFSSLLSLITLIHSHELGPAIDFVLRHSEIHLHFFLFSICSTIGQLLIFYTIKNFGAVVFTLIMTTRVLLSISLSCYMYGHNVTQVGFFGLVLVMAAVFYRVKRKAQGSQLIKWRGIDDNKAQELVQEWHEHVDM